MRSIKTRILVVFVILLNGKKTNPQNQTPNPFKKMKKHIPNLITSLNIVFGSLSVIFSIQNNLEYAAWCIFFAAVFDFFDGMSARLLKAYSDIGKELDSLADLISFGLAPGMIIYQLLMGFDETLMICQTNVLPYTALLLPLFAAWRLAIFNVSTNQKESFIGLPVPANALFFVSLPLIFLTKDTNASTTWIIDLFKNGYVLSGFVIIFSYLMVSKLPLFSLKFANKPLKTYTFQILYLIITIILLTLWKFVAIPLAIILYVLMSLIKTIK